MLKHHLVPKSRGTWLTLEHLHSKFDAIYDVSVIYENSVDKNGIRQNAPQLAGKVDKMKTSQILNKWKIDETLNKWNIDQIIK